MPNRDRERSETGEYVEEIGLDDVVDVFGQVRGPAVVTSSDVADALGCTTEAARQKLTRLYDRGEVDRRKSGRTTLWWHTGGEPIPDAVRERGTADEQGAAGDESDATAGAGASPSVADGDDERPRADAGEDERERARERIDELDLPGSGPKYDKRATATLAMYDLLRSNPGTERQKRDFADHLESEGVDLGYASFDSLWSNWVKANDDLGRPNLLAELPGVALYGEEYVYTTGGEGE